ncbi:MAG: M24 family metallopeptidase, partial [Arenicellales bacterium]
MQLNWHAQSPALRSLSLLDRDLADDEIDQATVRAYRLGRVREQMAECGVDACLLFDPINIRYATGSRNMQVFSQRNPARYLFLALSGPVILFEFTGCEHLAKDLETIDEVRPAITASFVAAGPAIAERERLWARETAAVIREHCGAAATIGIERVNAGASMALAAEGFRIVDAQYPVELARAIKSEEELKCVRSSIRATERAVGALREAIAPGLSEQQLWSILHQGVIAQGGDYIETRLLSAGERTNPWFQEASEKVIAPNELVALDTDVVGCFGYYCDFSRTFHAGPGKPDGAQKTLYQVSLEQLHHNINIIRPGMTFKEYSEHAWNIPERYIANRYYLSAHGVGMTGEYPYLYHRMDYPHAGYDGVIEPNMTLCVESYIGEEGGKEGVKLEQHCLVTESGIEVLSQFPFEEALMSGSDRGGPDLRLVAGNTTPDGAGEPDRPQASARPAVTAVKCGVADAGPVPPSRTANSRDRDPVAIGGGTAGSGEAKPGAASRQPSPPGHPPSRRAWNTRTPAGATSDGEVAIQPLSREALLRRIDLTLAAPGNEGDRIARLCAQAAGWGVTSICVPPSAVRDAARALRTSESLPPPSRGAVTRGDDRIRHRRIHRGSSNLANMTLGTAITLSEHAATIPDSVRTLRQAIRDGARAIEIAVDSEALRAGRQHRLSIDLRRLVHEAHDARAWATVVLEWDRLTEVEQVVAARLAAAVRADMIATGSGIDGNGASVRQVVLIREAAGSRPVIRAL